MFADSADHTVVISTTEAADRAGALATYFTAAPA